MLTYSAGSGLLVVNDFTPTSANFSANVVTSTTFQGVVAFLEGDSASLSFSMGGNAFGAATFSNAVPPAALITQILKTKTVYIDDATVSILFTVTDAAGRRNCSNSSTYVNVTVGGYVGQCSVFIPTALVGKCTVTLPSSVFSYSTTLTSTVSLIVAETIVSSDSNGVVAVIAATQRTPQSILGLYIPLPQLVVYAGDAVILTVYAQTSAQRTYALTSWSFFVVYNDTFLSFSYMETTLFNPPLVTANAGVLRLNAVGLKGTVSTSDVSGWFPVVTFTFLGSSPSRGGP